MIEIYSVISLKMKATRNRHEKQISPDDAFHGEPETGEKIPKQTLEYWLVQLSDRKDKSKREKSLSAIVQTLTMELKPEFVENNIVTAVYECLFSIKKGSVKELQFSLQAIGLLSIIIEDKDSAHEVYQDSLPVLSQALESKPNKSKILNCLAIVTFFGARNLSETETVMKIIWNFLKSDSVSKSPTVLSAAVSAWSFLLATVEKWSLKHKFWDSAISFFSNLLEEEDESVYASAGEALALIFEIDCLENFSINHTKAQSLQDCIIEKLKGQAIKASEEIEKQEAAMHVVEFFESGNNLETFAKIGRHGELKLSTWCKRLELNFFRDFLGEDGFVKHMRQNEKLQAIFDFKPREKIQKGSELYNPDREEMKINVFRGAGVNKANYNLNKARTRLMNKKRMVSAEENCFIISAIDEYQAWF